MPGRTKLSLPQLGPPAIWPPKFELILPPGGHFRHCKSFKPICIQALTLLYNLEFSFSFLTFFSWFGGRGVVCYGASLTLNPLLAQVVLEFMISFPSTGIISVQCNRHFVFRDNFLAHMYAQSSLNFNTSTKHIETHRSQQPEHLSRPQCGHSVPLATVSKARLRSDNKKPTFFTVQCQFPGLECCGMDSVPSRTEAFCRKCGMSCDLLPHIRPETA